LCFAFQRFFDLFLFKAQELSSIAQAQKVSCCQIVYWSCFYIVVVFYIDQVDFFGGVCVVATIMAR